MNLVGEERRLVGCSFERVANAIFGLLGVIIGSQGERRSVLENTPTA
jgi:hypothetical protein